MSGFYLRNPTVRKKGNFYGQSQRFHKTKKRARAFAGGRLASFTLKENNCSAATMSEWVNRFSSSLCRFCWPGFHGRCNAIFVQHPSSLLNYSRLLEPGAMMSMIEFLIMFSYRYFRRECPTSSFTLLMYHSILRIQYVLRLYWTYETIFLYRQVSNGQALQNPHVCGLVFQPTHANFGYSLSACGKHSTTPS
jgi:hypothetical protein